MELGLEALADALLELAARNEAADNLVERMLATPTENMKRIKAEITRLKRSRRFVHWDESAELAQELFQLLADLKATVTDPRAGAEMVTAFFQTDRGTFERCDDSNGHVGDVYRYDAKDLFVHYACRCDDKDWLAKLVLKLNRKDDYGVRDALVVCAADYLPEKNLRALIASFQKQAAGQSDKYAKLGCLSNVESLARQLGDAPLYERTRVSSWGAENTASRIDIARVYLECGDAETALSWLMRIPEKESFKDHERDRMLLEVYGKLEDANKQEEVAWRIFRRQRTAASLRELLTIIGEHQRDEVIAGEVTAIGNDTGLSYTDAAFLVEVGCTAEAANYLVERADQLNGGQYWDLLPLVDAMEASGKSLAAILLYRALLNSILSQGRAKAYQHGVRYLKKLDWLAKMVDDWRDIEDHEAYSVHLREKHGRKKSFWSRY